jgi:hypothetical protein
MEIIEYVEKLDTRFNNITKDYKYIYDNIHNYLNDGKISYYQLMDFEVSLEDLSIQINSLVFLFKQKQNENYINSINTINTNTNNNTIIDLNNTKDTKLDYIIDKAIFQFMPLLFIYFMVFDKESILYAKDFIENKYDNKKYDLSYVNKNSEFQYIIEPIDE